MSGFGQEIKELRVAVAECGVEVTLEKLLEVLEDALRVDRICDRCAQTPIGLCVECFLDLLKQKGEA